MSSRPWLVAAVLLVAMAVSSLVAPWPVTLTLGLCMWGCLWEATKGWTRT